MGVNSRVLGNLKGWRRQRAVWEMCIRDRLRDHAAGLLVRRFAIRNASPNITSENRSKVAIAEGRGNCVSIPLSLIHI